MCRLVPSAARSMSAACASSRTFISLRVTRGGTTKSAGFVASICMAHGVLQGRVQVVVILAHADSAREAGVELAA